MLINGFSNGGMAERRVIPRMQTQFFPLFWPEKRTTRHRSSTPIEITSHRAWVWLGVHRSREDHCTYSLATRVNRRYVLADRCFTTIQEEHSRFRRIWAVL